MQPQVRLVFVCKCGNLNCDEEALAERGRYVSALGPAPEPVQPFTAEWEE